jgi:hypothetical protein
MDKIMVCAGLLSPYDQTTCPRGLREATATGKQEPVKMGGTAQIGHVEVPGLRRPAESWITRY